MYTENEVLTEAVKQFICLTATYGFIGCLLLKQGGSRAICWSYFGLITASFLMPIVKTQGMQARLV
jgi:hypothetical protein